MLASWKIHICILWHLCRRRIVLMTFIIFLTSISGWVYPGQNNISTLSRIIVHQLLNHKQHCGYDHNQREETIKTVTMKQGLGLSKPYVLERCHRKALQGRSYVLFFYISCRHFISLKKCPFSML
ncbi:hypothetical protein FKM82_017082 [Ascaphus truei]